MPSSGEFAKEYEKLNKAQKEAVDATEGPVMVVAGPGTGKTQILALRIANILINTQVTPENILALTFTNAGVISMRERLLEITGDTAYRVNIFTFHAFCEHIIKELPFYFEELEGARVITDLERVELVEAILQKNKFKDLVSFHDEFSFLGKIVAGILAVKKEGLSSEEFAEKIPEWEKELLGNEDAYYKKDYGKFKKGDLKPTEAEKIQKKIGKARELGEIFALYQKELSRRGLYDFSDMVLYVLVELGKNKNLKADLGEQYQYILVDEHQDTNQGQNEILELLTDAPHLEKRPNIFTVGDEKQSIYRFQGASAETFRRFRDLYADVAIVTLTENYRSNQDILDGAHSLIVKSEGMADSAKLHSHEKESEKIAVREFSNYKFELLYLAEEIKEKIKSGVAPKEIAVLYRANKNVSDIKTIFDFYGIHYTIFSKDKILDDPNIRNLIHILKAVYDMNDDHNLGKALFAKFLRLDAYDVVRILEKVKSSRAGGKKHIFAVLEDKKALEEAGVKSVANFINFSDTLKEMKVESLNQNFSDFFKTFLSKIGYMEYLLASMDSRLQLVKLDKLLDEIKRQSEARKEYGLAEFIYFVDAFAKYNLDIESTNPEIIEGVSLMTAHGSKGREFKHVYIINAVRKSWEARRGGDSLELPVYQYDGDIEDERRLFYVAMTRAKKSLTISFARTDNDGREHEESEFVKEIEEEFKENSGMKEFEEKNIDKLEAFLRAGHKTATLFEPAYIRELFLKRGLNVSALNNFLSCPQKYLYKNLFQVPEAYSPTLKFGDIIHKSLEQFFSASARAEKILPKNNLLEAFGKEIAQTYFTEKDEEKFRERGEKLLAEYYDAYSASWSHKVKTELHFKRNFELDNRETLRLSGFIDKVEENDDGTIHIVDYKTGRGFSEKTKEEKADYERQIVFYNLLLEDYDEGNLVIDECTLDFVEKNKKGKFEQYSFKITREQMDKLREEINTCAHEVLSMEFLQKGCGKKDCEYCKLAGLSR